MDSLLRLLVIGNLPDPAPPLFLEAPGTIDRAATFAAARTLLSGSLAYDAIILDGTGAAFVADEVETIAAHAAMLVVLVDPDADHALGWLRRGAEDVLAPGEFAGCTVWRRIRFAALRWQRGEALRRAYATDPATGLPHRRQFVEHLSQLLALREREPSAMAVLAVRIEMPVDAIALDESDVLRRKVAVRLRAGVRASDIVAAVGDDGFVVLLGVLLAQSDAERVAEKLVALLVKPFTVGGAFFAVGVATGIASYPQDGNQADRLLRRALALAAAAPAITQGGPATTQDGRGAVRAAANDER